MRCEVTSEASDASYFPSPSYAKYLPVDLRSTFGQISKDGTWLWLVRGSIIEIYHTENRGERSSSYCFEAWLEKSTVITAVTEFKSKCVSFPCLLIALDIDSDGSLLCVFNCNTTKVVRAVELPYKITSLEVISGIGGASTETLQLNFLLRFMFGVVAVGTEKGNVFCTDLCLDENYESDEISPSKSAFVTKQTFTPKKRKLAIAKNQHICLFLNDNSFNGDSFEFRSCSTLLSKYPADDIFISSFKFITSLSTLAVGFNFGGVQLWNLQQLTLQHTISNGIFLQPVVAFAFQEPENDPRNFYYLWVVKGHNQQEASRPQYATLATLYSLTYHKRDWIKSFGPFYSDLQSCTKRFDFPLSSDPFAMQKNFSFKSRLISCQVIQQTDIAFSLGLDSASLDESDCGSESLSLFFMAWESWSSENDSPSSCHLVIFDLNQWYQAQMPSSFRCSSSQLSSYLGVFSLQAIFQKLGMEKLLSFYVVPRSVKKFRCLTTAEEFFYPSSLGFQIYCFSVNGVTKAIYSGLQRQLMYKLIEDGAKHLVYPKDMFLALFKSGLLTDLNESEGSVSVSSQREVLMQLALEQHLPNFFMKCFHEFKSIDSVTQEGCSSRAILNWAWTRLLSIKSSIDRLSQPLFNCSGSNIDKNTIKFLFDYRRQLKVIHSVFRGYQEYVKPRNDQELLEIQAKRNAICSISVYLQVLMWLHQINILPEVCEDDESMDTVVYHAIDLKNYYSLRREHVLSLSSSLGATDVLLIDGMIAEFEAIGNMWHEKGGSKIYPPPSVYAAVSSYLVNGPTLLQKHCLMYYLLLDIISELPEQQSFEDPELEKFSSMFGLSCSMRKLIQALWYLDHQQFEDAIEELLRPDLEVSDILPWQHQRIIKSFLYQSRPHMALRYINYMHPPENTMEDMKLHLSVLLSRGLIAEAFDYQREKQHYAHSEELLNHFFLACHELRYMKELMPLPLNSYEASTLIKFLNDSNDPRSQEMLVMYHLLHSNFFEASTINDTLETHSLNKTSSVHSRAPYRNALVESFLDAIPHTEKKLAEELKQVPLKLHVGECYSKPLSVTVKSCSLKEIAYSDLLNSMMFKASCAADHFYSVDQSPLENRARFEDIPFLRRTVTPDVKKPSVENATHTPILKRNLSNLNDFTPSKRSRLLDNTSFKLTDTIRKMPKNLARDIISLLQTPPIHRRTAKSSTATPVSSSSVSRPQSILKKSIQSSRTVGKDYYARTPSVCSLENESSDNDLIDEEEVTFKTSGPVTTDAAENMARQIRFKVPSPERQNQPITQKKKLFSPAKSSTPTRKPFLTAQQKVLSSDKKSTLPASPAPPSKPLLKKCLIFSPHETTKSLSLSTECSTDLVQKSNDFTPAGEPSIMCQEPLTGLPKEPVAVEAEVSLHSQESMSESSIYDSACESRSFIVSPRKPLRDKSLGESKSSEDTSIREALRTSAELLISCGISSATTPKSQTATEVHFPIVSPDVREVSHPQVESANNTIGADLHASCIGEASMNYQLQKSMDRLDQMRKQSDLYEKECLDRNLDFLQHSKRLTQGAQSSRTLGKMDYRLQKAEEAMPKEKHAEQSLADIVRKRNDDVPKKPDFLQDYEESYEEFSQKLKTDSGHSDQSKSGNAKPVLESSPDTNLKVASKSVTEFYHDSPQIYKPQNPDAAKTLLVQKTLSGAKSVTKVKKTITKTPKSSTRRAKSKEFSFAEPYSPASPEILKVLASSPERPVPSFVFSPPATRARIRQKKLDETMGSSFASCVSDKSFQSKQPPVDPLLQDIIQERSITEFSKPSLPSSARPISSRKASARKSSTVPRNRLTRLISPFPVTATPEATTEELPAPKHSMVLRKSRKKKTVKLF